MHACTHVLSRGFAKRVTAPRSVVLGRGGSTAPRRVTGVNPIRAAISLWKRRPSAGMAAR
jgi:hypothetical protein